MLTALRRRCNRRAYWRLLGIVAAAPLLLVSSCSVVVGGHSHTNDPSAGLTNLKRSDLLAQLDRLATTLDATGTGLAARQSTLTACIQLQKLLFHEQNNPGGILLQPIDDLPDLELARDTCPTGPRLAGRLIRSVLFQTRPLPGVVEPPCHDAEVGVRAPEAGWNVIGAVYLRVELVAQTSRLCIVNGRINAWVVTADGSRIQGAYSVPQDRYRTLPGIPGDGSVQWFRMSWQARDTSCRVVPVREVDVQLPGSTLVRRLPTATLPRLARTTCLAAPVLMDEQSDDSLQGP